MSTPSASQNLPSRNGAAATASSIADDSMLRTVGIVILLGIGSMHFLQIVTTFQAIPLLGGAYLVLIAATLAVAASLVTRGDSRSWAAAGIVSAGAVGGYIFTRLMNTPLDNQDVGNWSCMLGLAALFVETSLLVLSVYAGASKRARPEGAPPDLATIGLGQPSELALAPWMDTGPRAGIALGAHGGVSASRPSTRQGRRPGHDQAV